MGLIYAQPSEKVEIAANDDSTGLVGSLGYQVIDPQTAAVVVARSTAGVVEAPAGSGLYFARLTAPASSGSYVIVWDKGTISPETVAYDQLVINPSGKAPSSESSEELEAESLITLEELKFAMNIAAGEVDALRDARLQQAIRDASAAVRRFADRAFGKPVSAETRIYEWDHSGYLDIDDAMSVTAVVFTFGGFEFTIEPFYWRPEPQEGPPYTYLTIPHWAGIYDPQMGFEKNLDVISKDRGWPGLIPTIKVTASWGWPTIPDDVKRATIWTAAAMSEKPENYVSQSIAGYSYTTSNRTSGLPTAIPAMAQDILAAYVRFQI